MQKTLLNISILCMFTVLLYIKSNDDPLLPILKGSCIEFIFLKFETGNSLIRDLSLGILVSTIFWTFNVYLPEKKRELKKVNRLNRALKLILEAKNGNQYHWNKPYIYCEPLSENDFKDISDLKYRIKNKKVYNTLAEKALYEVCSESFELFRFLSVAANEISAEHGALWDSICRNITQLGKFNSKYHKAIQDTNWKLGDDIIDFSEGIFELNMVELLEKMEIWIKLNNN